MYSFNNFFGRPNGQTKSSVKGLFKCVITSHKLDRFIVNPLIPIKFAYDVENELELALFTEWINYIGAEY